MNLVCPKWVAVLAEWSVWAYRMQAQPWEVSHVGLRDQPSGHLRAACVGPWIGHTSSKLALRVGLRIEPDMESTWGLQGSSYTVFTATLSRHEVLFNMVHHWVLDSIWGRRVSVIRSERQGQEARGGERFGLRCSGSSSDHPHPATIEDINGTWISPCII